MSGFGAGIRRGAMAADQFTQIANALFRDRRISYRAKGLFGYISTHRDGWLVNIAALTALGPDGRDAVRAGLSELEKQGYLNRDRLRRPNGTLGKIVYSITDRPAALDVAPRNSAPAPLPHADRKHAAAYGAGIRRGEMAGDQFTQIANALFRDSRLSFKAKGLFGHISTHREGWQITIANLAHHGRESVHAVTTGLEELEKHGFLRRDRDRNPDGTLGQALYCITDLPSLQSTRSQPESGYPGLADPTLADPSTKNTNRKKTNKQNTRPLPPRPGCTAPRTSGRTDRLEAHPADEMHAGIRLLLDIGATHPELLLTGKPLTDQGRIATVMMDAGWSPAQLRHVITDRPLPHPVRTTVGAIIAARLRAAQAHPPPATAADHHVPGQGNAIAPATAERSSTATAARTVSEALTYRAFVECADCGLPGTAPGEDLCPACLGWPPCRSCTGPVPRRAHPDGDGRCAACTTAFTDQRGGSSS
ncbi:hypothetical protein ACIQMR_36170 [Streptomyces sp. NPDC091376]|uniref:hypothetical protein n=1 Tax=Streptomyces sp. NPDC091376 TaxID=3365994 RepID=UPI00382B7E35